MSDDITFKLLPGEMHQIENFVNRLAAAAGVSVAASLHTVGFWVAQTAGFSTRKAKTVRNPLKNKGHNPRMPARTWPLYIKIFKRKTGDFVRKYFRNPDGLSEAQLKAYIKTQPIAQIKRRGFSQSAWFWAASKAGGKLRSDTDPFAKRYSEVRDNTNHTEYPNIVLANVLDYAGAAWRAKGKNVPDTIAARALPIMEKNLKTGMAQRWAKINAS